MKYLIFSVLLLLISVFAKKAQFDPDKLNPELQTGDLLFCSSTSGALSKAIDQATQTGKETHFDHVGIVEVQNDTVWVLHYQKLGIPVPEGEPGCNPNGMAASEKLEIIGEVSFKEK